jgi:hypothetical protein
VASPRRQDKGTQCHRDSTTWLPAVTRRSVDLPCTAARTKVDTAAKTVAIKTASGTTEVLKYTEKTTVEAGEATAKGATGTAGAAKEGSAATLSASKEGTDVVARYVSKGGEKTATSFHEMGKASLKVTEGVVTGVDAGAKTVTVKTKDGSEQVYHHSEKATVETGQGVAKGAEATGHGLKVGEKVTVNFTESTGRKIAHLFSK